MPHASNSQVAIWFHLRPFFPTQRAHRKSHSTSRPNSNPATATTRTPASTYPEGAHSTLSLPPVILLTSSLTSPSSAEPTSSQRPALPQPLAPEAQVGVRHAEQQNEGDKLGSPVGPAGLRRRRTPRTGCWLRGPGMGCWLSGRAG
ncbi:hypothetical protein MBM_04805 [Drepanopeziza brunnea f. sp. 'multigermtubi' MB_m1]|uniref:Uncharacterized protein n=1 Tax=Marssonina brunnea f. sp. multigermtubi (strain MB_m1) TaxID=1072389 RepID=K1X927_MARBU|nr:uncharacterized protein MBM_04805 [Drepanopeziza brunnea f. sp. 'multigermtubi' MB_m1]EKD17228.1 hypothetical protein MBM_04805 [Drepanopeziza brunnea f. sp. 'multigermtubi' MB_m1]